MKCSIVKDLLSNYMNGLCSEETNREIKEHLDNCSDCHSHYEKKLPGNLPEILSQQNIPVFKRLKTKLLQKNVIVTALLCTAVLVGIFIFFRSYYHPIPYDQNHMSVSTYKAAIISQNGYSSLRSIDRLKNMIPEDCDNVIDAVELTYQGINNISLDIIGRNINRNSEAVTVYYYCYKETLWDSIFADPELRKGAMYMTLNGNGVIGNGLDKADLIPQMREIYYLPLKNPSQFDRLSDEEFDRLREKSSLIWRGIS